jgi:hypothetical protein
MPHVGIVGYDFRDYDSDPGGWPGFLTRVDGLQTFFFEISPVKFHLLNPLNEFTI